MIPDAGMCGVIETSRIPDLHLLVAAFQASAIQRNTPPPRGENRLPELKNSASAHPARGNSFRHTSLLLPLKLKSHSRFDVNAFCPSL